MSRRRPTLREVARAAGVSHMTVQRVVSGAFGVAPATAERVRLEAERLGYRPDPALTALSAYRWGRRRGATGNVLAFLDGEETAYSGEVLEGARREADLLGYRVDRFVLPATTEGQVALGRALYHRGIRGLLFGPSGKPRLFDGWEWGRFAPVSLDALAHQPAMNAVAMDYFHGATVAMEHLHAAGCRRIGLAVDAGLQARSGNRWLGGCLAAGWWLDVFGGRVDSAREVRGWLREKRIDGVLSIHGRVLRAAQALKVRTAALNALGCPPGVSCLRLAPAQIGVEGVRLLHHALLRGETGLPEEPKTVALRGRWG